MSDDLRCAYASAQDAARHSDILMWQVTSITWGANVVLMGFVLQSIGDHKTRPLAAVTVSIIAIALTLFVAHFFRIAKVGQGIAYEICRDIEAQLQFPEKRRVHTRIDEVYSRGVWPKAKHCVWLITALFLVFWIGVLVAASRSQCAS
jgi:hypothetical protein